MSKYENRGFMPKQRAFLKLYLLNKIKEKKGGYGSQFLTDLQKEFKQYGYSPTHTELYKTLHELTRDGAVKREKRLLGEPGVNFQEIIVYSLTDEGQEQLEIHNKLMKVELERCIGLLNKAIRDNYGPIKKKA
ncbi:helix-turn-helix transcriptional regulator [Cytobacillus oceanisediminis]|uniref:helix-turn-helix transcriptional regulator n=1 Tax=Cytobacillus oceanisediminis TaxID=665099 RepID=UPI001FB38C9D|nr:helix-turn-helix transcriptional regulator [Cytobacillus oceanisediminis]UOE58011.1 helix-turn-helix transcriptional regulator [Cytobacillus oceanisediminis]